MAKNQQMMQQEKITKTLTDKEKLFAELAAENFYASETKPNYQLAIEAGYAEKSARQRAYENLNPRIKPYVVLYIEELKEDFRIRNQITPDKHMARLQQLGKKAEDKEMLGVALNAEVHRGKMAGYYIDRKLNVNKEVSDMTEEELEQELKNKAEQYGLIDSHNKEGKK